MDQRTVKFYMSEMCNIIAVAASEDSLLLFIDGNSYLITNPIAVTPRNIPEITINDKMTPGQIKEECLKTVGLTTTGEQWILGESDRVHLIARLISAFGYVYIQDPQTYPGLVRWSIHAKDKPDHRLRYSK